MIILGCERLVQMNASNLRKPRYAMMREVAAIAIVIDGFFRGVCPILEPGETITSTMGYVPGLLCLPVRPISRYIVMDCPGRTACAVHRLFSWDVWKHPVTCRN